MRFFSQAAHWQQKSQKNVKVKCKQHKWKILESHFLRVLNRLFVCYFRTFRSYIALKCTINIPCAVCFWIFKHEQLVLKDWWTNKLQLYFMFWCGRTTLVTLGAKSRILFRLIFYKFTAMNYIRTGNRTYYTATFISLYMIFYLNY